MSRKFYLSLLPLLVCIHNAFNQTEAEKILQLSAFIERGMSSWEIPGLAVSVVKNGKIIFQKGFGLKDIQRQEAVDEHTIFGICSTTKAMTAFTLAILVDEKKLNWDDPVVKYLPAFKLKTEDWTRQIRVRDLLTHNAGLPNLDFLWYANTLEVKDMLHRLPYVDQAYPVRGGYTYQNVMYAIAGHLVEKVSGIPWTTFVQQRIFKPLGMHETFPTYDSSRDYPNRMVPHFRVSDKVTPIPNMIIDQVAPAGSVWSNVNDMSKWMLFLLEKGRINGKSLIDDAIFNELFQPQTVIPRQDFYPTINLTLPTWTTYGLGWFQQDYKGKSLHFHTGSIDGDIAMVGLLPEDSLGVFILGNLDHAEIRHAILFEVIDLFAFGFSADRDWNTEIALRYQQMTDQSRKERVPEMGIHEKINSARISGQYNHPLYGQINIEITRDHFINLHLTPLLTLTLTPVTETEYMGKYHNYFWFEDEKVIFEFHPKNNQVLALQIGQRRWIKEK